MKRFRIHDLQPLPPVDIVDESALPSSADAHLRRDICVAQNVVIADLHRQILALQAQLDIAQLRAEWAQHRVKELEQQHEALLMWVDRAERALGELVKPRRTLRQRIARVFKYGERH
ncbi:MAG: hypothetical protein KatS3mg051_1930 [Anaerolineae bacterium]|nr:MAG: hypothetical protein KatS3mg051_1930 [Anaerolineae bacterium]